MQPTDLGPAGRRQLRALRQRLGPELTAQLASTLAGLDHAAGYRRWTAVRAATYTPGLDPDVAGALRELAAAIASDTRTR